MYFSPRRFRLASFLAPVLLLLLLLLALLYFHAVRPSTHSSHLQDVPSAYENRHGSSWLSHIWNDAFATVQPIPLERVSGQIEGPSPSPPSTVLARYGSDLVLRLRFSSAEEAKALTKAIDVLFLDVWEFGKEWADIRLSKDTLPSLLALLPRSMHNSHSPLMHDLSQAVVKSYPGFFSGRTNEPFREASRPFTHDLRSSLNERNVFFDEYRPLSVITPWMRLLHSLFPTHVRMISVGTSYEGREIFALRVGVHPRHAGIPPITRKTIIVSGGSHAREWVATSSVSYAAYSFITAYGKSKLLTTLLEEFDWIFIPTINVDGYAYSWSSDRLWRKNRQQTTLRFCQGVDLDRSYGFKWDGEFSNGNPCSESFSGQNPFQGFESRQFANWVRNESENNNVKFVGFVDFHSYSQQILYPYSFSCTSVPPSLENLEELAIGLAKAIRVAGGEMYSVASACEGSVIVSDKVKECGATQKRLKDYQIWPQMESGGGSALDWFYHEMKVPYAYQIKLRDTGSYGFLLPSSDIVPTGKEAFSALQYFGSFLIGDQEVETTNLDGGGLTVQNATK